MATGKSVKEKVIDSAIDLFVDAGYSAVSLKKISEKAEVSTSGLQRVFQKKSQIMKEIWTIADDLIMNEVDSRLKSERIDPEGNDLHALLMCTAASIFDLSDQSSNLRTRSLVRLTFGEAGVPISTYASEELSEVGPVEARIRAWLEKGCQSTLDAENAIGVFLGFLYGKVFRDCVVAGGQPFWVYDRKKMLSLLDTFLQGVLKKEEVLLWQELEGSGVSKQALANLALALNKIVAT